MNTKSSINKEKGMQTQVCKNGAQFFYNIFALHCYLLQCFIIAQYIAPQWKVKGRIRVIPYIWKAKDQVIRYLKGKTPNIFVGALTLTVLSFGNSVVFVEVCKWSCDSK